MHAVAGCLVLAVALAWLPGQSQASATRWWVATAFLPLALAAFPLHRLRARLWWLAPWGLLALSAAAASAWQRDPGAGLFAALIQVSWTAALALGLVVGADGATRRVWPRWVAATGVVVAVPGIVVPGGALGNSSLLAGLLVLTTLWTALSIREERFSPWTVRAALGIGTLVQLAALARCGSLGAWAALVCGVMAWAVVVYTATARSRYAAVALLAVVLVAGALGLARIDGVRTHLQGRAHLIRCSVDVVTDAFPGGVGAGQFHRAFLESQATVLDQQRADDQRFRSNAYHAHNEALHVLAERGVTGLALLLAPLVAALLRMRDPTAWAVIVGAAVLGLVSLPLYEPVSWVVVAASVGVVLGARADGAPVPRTPAIRPPRWVLAAILAVGVPCSLMASGELLGDRLLVRGVAEGDEALLESSARLSLRKARPLQHRAALLTQFDPVGAEALALEALALDPSPNGWLIAGDAAMHIPDPQRAISHYREAVRLNPRLFAGHFNLARAYEEAGDRHSARRHAVRARSLRPSDPRLDWLPR